MIVKVKHGTAARCTHVVPLFRKYPSSIPQEPAKACNIADSDTGAAREARQSAYHWASAEKGAKKEKLTRASQHGSQGLLGTFTMRVHTRLVGLSRGQRGGREFMHELSVGPTRVDAVPGGLKAL
jgi:hypothetical protein